jgi:hypothetical protein
LVWEPVMHESMTRLKLLLLVFAIGWFVQGARAYEYPLQFTSNPPGQDLLVAGYRFEGNEVVGNCSYRVVPGSSGRSGGNHGKIQIQEQTCRWDLYGNLLRVTPGAPAVPAPIQINGTMTVYAANAKGGSTGRDTKMPGGGFVNTPGSHYSWVTPDAHAVTLQKQSGYSSVITLKSDGDAALEIRGLEASSLNGWAVVETATCSGKIQPDATCSITIRFDLSKLSSPGGQFDDTLTIKLKSDAGVARDFIQTYTIVVPKEIERD